jgi:uncharacterized protein YjbI with pentapeptide repeats
MKIIKPMTLGLLTRPFEFRREFWLGIAAIAFLPVGETPILLPETDLWPFLAGELPPDQPLDAVIRKTLPEYLAIAHAYAPNGVPVTQVRTGIQLGPSTKMLDVFGDRWRDRAGALLAEPVPFSHMPIDWAHAYGGAGVADNPLGVGAMPRDGSDGRIFPVPNILNPRLGREALRTPAGYGPVDQMWPVRAKLAGTYDDAWVKQDFPGFARNIDWTFFNAAQQDQWLLEPLNGDETYAFKNLHPTQPLLKGRLPGLVPRSFLVRKGSVDSFEEVKMSLTTVWFFPHRERIALVHHGQARLAEEDASDIGRLVLGADGLGVLRSADAFHAVMVQRADSKDAATHALRDEDLVPAEWLQPTASPPDVEGAPASPLRRALARGRARREQAHAEARNQLKARNLDPDKYLPAALPPDPPLPTLAELPAFAAALRAEMAAKVEKAKQAAAAKAEEIAAMRAAAGQPLLPPPAPSDRKPNGPPQFSAAKAKEQMAQQAAALRARGTLTKENEARLEMMESGEQLDKAEEVARDGYRRIAHMQDPADPVSAERSAEIRRIVANDTAAARALYDLHGADLSGLDLSGVDLSGVCLDGANLTGTSFANAKLVNAVLAHAHMENCVFDSADLSGASLGKAHLAKASLRRAVLKKSVLAGADLTDATLAGADLEGANLADAIVANADFSRVHAPAILAIKLSLRRLWAPRIKLDKAKFIECDLQGAQLTGASLEQAVFLESNLTGADFAGANMRKAVFVKQCCLAEANLAGADLTQANLRETDLHGATLDEAILVKADLSGANLGGAGLANVHANESLWVAADLRNADLRLGSLANADMARSDMRGANLTGASVYEANMARVKLDAGTKRGGMLHTRTRFRPLYEPPEEAQA